LENDSGLRQKR